MNRRDFLRDSFLSATGFFLSSKLALAKVSAGPKKILIIGAGLSGLVAAYELTKLGHNVIIIEAQSRAGGRVLTVRDFPENLYAEAGAARIPYNHELTHRYIKEFKLQLLPFYPSDKSKFLRIYDNKAAPVNWDEFTEASSIVVSLENQKDWQKIKGGNDLLPRSFAETLKQKILYDSPVVKIERSPGEVSVTFNEKGKLQTLRGDYLICTIPFTMLRKIEISPKLSDAKTELINKMAYDSASRIFLQTKKRFWEKRGLNGFGFGENFAEIWNSTFGQTGMRGILQSYVRDPYSSYLTQLPPNDRIKTTIKSLDVFFPELRTNLEKGMSKCWSEDKWVEGAWAHPLPKQVEIIRLPENRIFLAGEHTSAYASWMQGALQSGLRVVEEINKVNV